MSVNEAFVPYAPLNVLKPVGEKVWIVDRAADPDGKAPFDMQLTFWRHRKAVKVAVERMIAWNPERILSRMGGGTKAIARPSCGVLSGGFFKSMR